MRLPRPPQAKGDLSAKLQGDTIKPITDWVVR